MEQITYTLFFIIYYYIFKVTDTSLFKTLIYQISIFHQLREQRPSQTSQSFAFIGALAAAIAVFLDACLAFCFLGSPDSLLLLSFLNFWFLILSAVTSSKDAPVMASWNLTARKVLFCAFFSGGQSSLSYLPRITFVKEFQLAICIK